MESLYNMTVNLSIYKLLKSPFGGYGESSVPHLKPFRASILEVPIGIRGRLLLEIETCGIDLNKRFTNV
jgi:hypothetical protein